MDNDKDLLQALDGIRAELALLNKNLSALAAQQGRAGQSSPAAPGRPSPSRPSAGRPVQGRPPSGGYGKTGAYKRTASTPSEEGAPTGYGAEMAARFPKKRGAGAPKGKPPAKKGGGYPKKTR